MLDAGRGSVFETSQVGTMLHLAARHNNTSALEWALGLGLDPCALNDRQQTPLHSAAAFNYPRACLALMRHFPTHDRDAPLDGPTLDRAVSMARPSFKNDSRVDDDLLRQTIASYARLDRDSLGMLPVHVAAVWGARLVIPLLANTINERDGSGRTPLQIALQHRHADVARNLIALGANVEAADNSGSTALNAAIKAKMDDVALEIVRRTGN